MIKKANGIAKVGSDAHYQVQNDLHHLRMHAEITANKARHDAAKNLAASEAKKLMFIKNPKAK